MQFPISIELHRSHFLLCLLLGAHLLAVLAIFALPWSPAWRVLVVLAVLVSAVLSGRPVPVVRLRLGRQGGMKCWMTEEGPGIEAHVQPDSAIFSHLLVLRLKLDDGRRLSLTLLPDSMPGGQFRLLRLFLRWQDPTAKREDHV